MPGQGYLVSVLWEVARHVDLVVGGRVEVEEGAWAVVLEALEVEWMLGVVAKVVGLAETVRHPDHIARQPV